MRRVEILIEGYLDAKWHEWLGEVTLSYPQPDQTLLIVYVPDQSALYGLIAKLRDLGVHLLSISYINE